MGKDGILELIKSRCTHYAFSKKPVTDKELQSVLEAGRWAPSCINTQPWVFLVVREPKTITKLSEVAHYGEFHTNPQVMIVVVLRSKYWWAGARQYLEAGRLSYSDAYLSMGMPVMLMSLQAHSMGMGTAILTPDEQLLRRVLPIDATDRVPVMIGLGYPAPGSEKEHKHERKPLADIVCYEKVGYK